jgi:hypothetical protein
VNIVIQKPMAGRMTVASLYQLSRVSLALRNPRKNADSKSPPSDIFSPNGVKDQTARLAVERCVCVFHWPRVIRDAHRGRIQRHRSETYLRVWEHRHRAQALRERCSRLLPRGDSIMNSPPLQLMRIIRMSPCVCWFAWLSCPAFAKTLERPTRFRNPPARFDQARERARHCVL